ncbi:MAG TPA: hypothetical protein VNE41_01255 [Chitinophagaceae bacterium]|nr:hypothetical protein [Chitinophagaceae bacterium]
MADQEKPRESWISKLKNKYRLVILNEETYEEVTSFKLSRMGVYVTLCTLFVMLVAITVGVVVFTPLKYYIPGYGNMKQRKEYIRLNLQVDSLENIMSSRDRYMKDLHRVLSGSFNPAVLDTAQLKIPAVVNSTN